MKRSLCIFEYLSCRKLKYSLNSASYILIEIVLGEGNLNGESNWGWTIYDKCFIAMSTSFQAPSYRKLYQIDTSKSPSKYSKEKLLFLPNLIRVNWICFAFFSRGTFISTYIYRGKILKCIIFVLANYHLTINLNQLHLPIVRKLNPLVSVCESDAHLTC